MDTFRDIWTSYANIESVISFIKFALPLFVTFMLGRYTTNHPRIRGINQRQLEHVYLPLYKLFKKSSLQIEYDRKEVLRVAKELNNILSDNYELAFPGLHDLNDELIAGLALGHTCRNTLSKIMYQVDLDYEILKKKLGYPHTSSYALFKRMTPHDKYKYISGHFGVFIAVLGIILCMFVEIEESLLHLFLFNFFSLIVLDVIRKALGNCHI